MLCRTIIALERGQLRAVRTRARAQGVSVAEFIRRLIDEHLAENRRAPHVPRRAFEKLVGLGSSGRQDVADVHDEALGRAIRDDHAR